MKRATSKRFRGDNAQQTAAVTKCTQKIKSVLTTSSVAIEELAKEKKFYKTSNSKISGISFILATIKTILSGVNTLQNIACQLAQILGETVSKQSVSQKFYSRHIDFVSSVLKSLFQQRLFCISSQETGILAPFKHVWVQDSTCIALCPSMASFFPGRTVKGELTASCRIQTILDIKNNQYSQMNVGSFRNNDQSATADILPMLTPSDLVLRDLGYAKIEVFQCIIDASAYFVSKLSYGVTIWDEIGNTQWDLLRRLKKTPFIDQMVLIGAEKKLLARLVVTKLPDDVAERRRRTADKNKSGTTNHSKEYYEFLGYSVLITNVTEDIWTSKQIFTLYRLRWRIEIIFKSWKSGALCLPTLLSNEKLSYGRVMMIIYCFLILVAAFLMPIYAYCLKIKKNDGSTPNISILKLAQWFKINYQDIDLTLPIEPQIDKLAQLIIAYCCYDKRKKYPNFLQILN
jgi:hypothetical protein